MTTAQNIAQSMAYQLCEFAHADGEPMDFPTILDGVSWNMRDIRYIRSGEEMARGAQNGYITYAVEHMREDMVRSVCEFLNVDVAGELAELAW